jgi:predicted RND superfamily exporter protein
MLGSLPDQLESLHRALAAGPITHDKLPAGLVDRMVSAEGDVRVEVYPREDVRDNDAMARFIAAVREVSPDATGSAIGVYEASRAAVSALRQALISAVVVIALLLLVLWRTIGEMLLVMTPLALASVLTAALAVLLGIPFNFADIIVLPLLLGIGVDSGIHLVQRWRLTGARPAELLETSTAHGVIFSALTTLASFATLSFATHRGIASLGQLLTVGVATMVLCNLFILPALIELRMRSPRYRPRITRP